jgi:phosphate transport system substrate-binding protein
MKTLLKAGLFAVAGLVSAAVIAGSAMAADIVGAGASFPYPIYSKWAAAYKTKTGIGLNYQSIGSGGGIAQIKAKTVTFGASDMPLKPAELDAAGLVMFPTVVGGVVPVVHLPGVGADRISLDGPTLADIYLGKIVKWNDPAIARLNPGVHLPNMAIVVVHRSDGSGTTFIFTNYLGKVSKEWGSSVGSSTAVEWPVGIGAKGNEGVAANVGQTVGSIGYVEYAYAMQNKLAYTKMKNRAGNMVSPNMESFVAAAANADWAHADHFYMILTDQPGAKSWPIENPTFVLFYKNPKNQADSRRALEFFKWAYADGDQMAESLLYIPLPDSVVQLIQNSWKQIQGSGM